MSGNRASKDVGSFPLLDLFTATANGSYTVATDCLAHISVTGGGGGGDYNGTRGSSGAGGGAAYRLMNLKAGQVITFTIPAGAASRGTGGTVSCSLPDGTTMSATGGAGAFTDTGGAVGGVGSGGSLNRRGGIGANSYGAPTASPDPGGGDVAPAATFAYGAPSAGFGDISSYLKGGGYPSSTFGRGGNGLSGDVAPPGRFLLIAFKV
jgi:hypothetical protein